MESLHHKIPAESSLSSSLLEEDTSMKQQQQHLWSPRRPLTAYNLFFQLERKRLLNDEHERSFTFDEIRNLAFQQRCSRTMCKPKRKHRKTHGKLGFREMARLIGKRWKKLDLSDKKIFDKVAAMEKEALQAMEARRYMGHKEGTSSPSSSEAFHRVVSYNRMDTPTNSLLQQQLHYRSDPSTEESSNQDGSTNNRFMMESIHHLSNPSVESLCLYTSHQSFSGVPGYSPSVLYSSSNREIVSGDLKDVYNFVDRALDQVRDALRYGKDTHMDTDDPHELEMEPIPIEDIDFHSDQAHFGSSANNNNNPDAFKELFSAFGCDMHDKKWP